MSEIPEEFRVLPAHPEDGDYVALLRHHDMKQSRWIVVPEGAGPDFDADSAGRRWLRPYLGDEWHLFAILPLRPSAPTHSKET